MYGVCSLLTCNNSNTNHINNEVFRPGHYKFGHQEAELSWKTLTLKWNSAVKEPVAIFPSLQSSPSSSSYHIFPHIKHLISKAGDPIWGYLLNSLHGVSPGEIIGYLGGLQLRTFNSIQKKKCILSLWLVWVVGSSIFSESHGTCQELQFSYS